MSTSSPHTILVIDDDVDVRSSIATMLETGGYSVIKAGNGVEAERAIERGNVELVLTDLLMPDKDGIEVINDLRKSRPGLPIVAMSGGGHLPRAQYLAMARRLGAKDVLEKPFTFDQLTMTVERQLRDAAARSADAESAKE